MTQVLNETIDEVAVQPSGQAGGRVRSPINAAYLSNLISTNLPVLIAAVVAGVVFGVVFLTASPKSFTGFAVVRVDPFVVDEVTQSGRTVTGNNTGLEVEARSDAVLDRAGATLTPPATAADLRPSVTITQVGTSAVLEVRVERPDRQRSADIANAVAAAILADRSDRVEAEIQATTASIDAEVAELDAVVQGLRADADALDTSSATQVQLDRLVRQRELALQLEARAAFTDEANVTFDSEAIDAEIAALDAQIEGLVASAASQSLELSAIEAQLDRREAELSLLLADQARIRRVAALDGEVIRAAVPDPSRGRLVIVVAGLAFGLLAVAVALFVLLVRRRRFASSDDISDLAPVIAEIDAGVLRGGTLDSAQTLSMRRLSVWLGMQNAQRLNLVSMSDTPDASMLVSVLGPLQHQSAPLNVIDFERNLGGGGATGWDRPGIVTLPFDALRDPQAGAAYVVVSGAPRRSALPFELAAYTDGVVLVVRAGEAKWNELVEVADQLELLGSRLTGIVEIS